PLRVLTCSLALYAALRHPALLSLPTRRSSDLMLVGRDAPPLEPVVQDLARGGKPLGDSRQISVLHAHVHARLGDRRARYARAHEPCAHDAQAAHDGGSRRVGDPEVLLESGGGEKDLDQLTRDVSDGELPEQL